VTLLERLLDRHGSRLHYVLVLNQLRGDDFGILEKSGQKERALSLGASVITIKKLRDSSMVKIDGSSSSFWAVANKPDGDISGLKLLERQRVRIWLQESFAAIATLGV
jgi:hypothetical protein